MIYALRSLRDYTWRNNNSLLRKMNLTVGQWRTSWGSTSPGGAPNQNTGRPSMSRNLSMRWKILRGSGPWSRHLGGYGTTSRQMEEITRLMHQLSSTYYCLELFSRLFFAFVVGMPLSRKWGYAIILCCFPPSITVLRSHHFLQAFDRLVPSGKANDSGTSNDFQLTVCWQCRPIFYTFLQK